MDTKRFSRFEININVLVIALSVLFEYLVMGSRPLQFLILSVRGSTLDVRI